LGKIRLLFGEAAFIKNVDPERKDGAAYVLKDDGLALSNGLNQRHIAQACVLPEGAWPLTELERQQKRNTLFILRVAYGFLI